MFVKGLKVTDQDLHYIFPRDLDILRQAKSSKVIKLSLKKQWAEI